MNLMTPELEKLFKKLQKESSKEDPTLIAKFFNPTGIGTWYATEMWYTIEYEHPAPPMQNMQSNSDKTKSAKMQNMREQTDSQDQKAGLFTNGGTVESAVQEWNEDESGLHVAISTKPSESLQKVRSKISSGTGKEDKAVPGAKRNGSSRERRSDGRSTGKPPVDDEDRTSKIPLSNIGKKILDIEAWRIDKFKNAKILETKFFGFVDLLEQEWGYFSLDELEALKLPYGLEIEVDVLWRPKTFSEARIEA